MNNGLAWMRPLLTVGLNPSYALNLKGHRGALLMTRQTSIETYNEINTNGLLSKRKWEAYDLLFYYGPATSTELTNKFKETRSLSILGGIHQRLSELERIGVIMEVGKKLNPTTKMMNTLWDVTDKLPIKLEKSKRYRCHICHGKGYIEETQSKLF